MPASPVSTQMLGTFKPRPQGLATPEPLGGWKPPEDWSAPDPHTALNYQTYQRGTTAWRLQNTLLPWSTQTKGSFYNF